ncbi:hypothetical protein AGDE_12665 [Angomonas deanei]|uniref:Uncharacterized protein n=1 Tax=Angomonas deanei TaxID=59799 RepID=A0A7G2C5I6_9TRYP|nr:hypothetical protein AGDE_12665 [Angomonas deanei]CAD2214990.1 hypothetical protein, conserved [Angomonas deanei]|eukprot:EPY23876.1 hypothetical protein AGDE_12665 [Angomonas deanei]
MTSPNSVQLPFDDTFLIMTNATSTSIMLVAVLLMCCWIVVNIKERYELYVLPLMKLFHKCEKEVWSKDTTLDLRNRVAPVK